MGVPLVVSVHGGDVLYTAAPAPLGSAAGVKAVARGLGAARLTLANSQGIAELCRAHGAGEVRVVHLGADPPDSPRASRREGAAPTLVTVGHLVARKRHADVLRALAVLGRRHPTLRYEIVGDGPERIALEGLAARLGVSDRVDMRGQLEPAQALERARAGTLFVMPSTEEAFGVAYIEAMAGGVPAIGCRGEPGPEEIAAAGDGFVLVPPGDIERLTQRIDELLSDPHRLREAGQRARESVAAGFTWERCGHQTLIAYEHALHHRDEARTMKPVLFVTGTRSARSCGRVRSAARARGHRGRAVRGTLAARSRRARRVAEPRARTATELPFPHRYVSQRATARLASSGAYRAVICSTGGRVALPAPGRARAAAGRR